MKNKFFLIILFFTFFFPLISSAHYIIGYVNDAVDGTLANGHRVVVWNPINGVNDNVTGLIGPNGESHTEDLFMVDCELLSISCEVGDELSIRVYDTGDGYVSAIIKVNVTGAGFDFTNNLSLNTPLIFSSVVVDDDLTLIPDEIDLLAANVRAVTCGAVVEDPDGGYFGNFFSEFFSEVSSFYSDTDANNHHYTNSSCFVNTSYGTENESYVTCSYLIWYYANSENWKCVIEGSDLIKNSTGEDTTFINPLLSIEIESNVDFGIVDGKTVSDESEVVIYNRGNVILDLALSGHGTELEDGLAMECTKGENISVNYQKYNITSPNLSDLNLEEFESTYKNLTSSPSIADFNLNFRKDDEIDNAYNSTYWRIYVPSHSGGDCSGNIIFGAVLST